MIIKKGMTIIATINMSKIRETNRIIVDVNYKENSQNSFN